MAKWKAIIELGWYRGTDGDWRFGAKVLNQNDEEFIGALAVEDDGNVNFIPAPEGTEWRSIIGGRRG